MEKSQTNQKVYLALLVERDNPNKNYVCFIGGFALMLDIQKIRA